MTNTRLDVLGTDRQFAEFVAAFPSHRRPPPLDTRAHAAFVRALHWTSFETLLQTLEQHKQSEQWWELQIIPSLVTWLEEERWTHVLPMAARLQARFTPFEHARRLGLK